MVQVQPHILLVTFPAQGHLNPTLLFAKRLIRLGVRVTLATNVFAHRLVTETSSGIPSGLNFAVFDDGFQIGYKRGSDDGERFMHEIRTRGSETLRETIVSCASEPGRFPVTCLVYTLLLPWAAEVARELHVPSALLWIQPATVLDIYYYYFNGYEELIAGDGFSSSYSIELPGLPPLTRRDIPSFLHPEESDSKRVIPFFKAQVDKLATEENPKVLVNTFDALESMALKAIDKLNLTAVGPLIPSAFLDGKDPTDTSSGIDFFEKSRDYLEWMNSKDEKSIVYVSFGSLLDLPIKQMDEIGRALLDGGRPFLWVTRERKGEKGEEEEEKLSRMEELEQLGMIVPWCSQLEVLSHPSLGCFVTHCGWNSTLESMVSGVPVVAFPTWTDQGTNAKLIEDVWRIGVRVTANEEGTVESKEILRCMEIVMGGGEKGEELRRNVEKWKGLGREAMMEGGSSDRNLKAFVEEMSPSCSTRSV